jgi:hypothetical protein
MSVENNNTIRLRVNNNNNINPNVDTISNDSHQSKNNSQYMKCRSALIASIILSVLSLYLVFGINDELNELIFNVYSIDDSIEPVLFHQLKCCAINTTIQKTPDFTLYPIFGYPLMDDIDLNNDGYSDTCYILYNSACNLFVNTTYYKMYREDFDFNNTSSNNYPLCFPDCDKNWNDKCTARCAAKPEVIGRNSISIMEEDVYAFSPGYDNTTRIVKKYNDTRGIITRIKIQYFGFTFLMMIFVIYMFYDIYYYNNIKK